ncbi:hypothetical protein SAMN05216325_102207 [Nitrosomonas marina]|uniref:Uncharacterized protein n=1 Tax=Nitrosomonas marina TaxID=917 RepID=A0A1H8BFC9_9PROT|nr:hypothetical protein SAMN05216325_102207 [Nitrosomonas marina]
MDPDFHNCRTLGSGCHLIIGLFICQSVASFWKESGHQNVSQTMTNCCKVINNPGEQKERRLRRKNTIFTCFWLFRANEFFVSEQNVTGIDWLTDLYPVKENVYGSDRIDKT